MDKRLGAGPHGFTMIEVIVASTILVLAILPTLAAFSVTHTDITYSGRMATAVGLAEQTLETLKAGAFPPAAGTATSGAYQVAWTVTSVGYGSATEDLRRISLTVTWPQPTRPGRYDVVALVGKPY